MEQSITSGQFKNLLEGPDEEFEAFFIARPHLLDAAFSGEQANRRPLFDTIYAIANHDTNGIPPTSVTLPKLRFLVSREEVDVNGHKAEQNSSAHEYNPFFMLLHFCCSHEEQEALRVENIGLTVEVFKLLLDRGADINNHKINTYHGSETLLMFTSNLFCVELVNLLIQYKVRVNDANETGFTPLMSALNFDLDGVNGPFSNQTRRLKILKSLLDAGASIDAQDQSGTTALMYSVRVKDDEAFKFLMQRNANPSLRNTAGQTAFDMAEPAFKAQLKPFFKDRIAATAFEVVQNKKELAGEKTIPPNTTSIVGSLLGLPPKPRQGGRKTKKSRRKTKKRKSRRRKY